MFKRAVCLVFALSIAPGGASALDWSIKGRVDEAVEASDNQFLKTALAGWSVGSYSTINTDFQARTPTSTFDFDGTGSYKKYWGPGLDGLTSEYIAYNLKARYELAGSLPENKTYFEVTRSAQNAALAVFNTLGITPTTNGQLIQTSALAGFSRQVTTQDTVGFWVRSIYTNYDPSSTGIPFTDTLASAAWKHRLNSVATLVGTSEIEYLDYQNVPGTRILITRNLGGIDATLSPLLTVKAAAGWSHLVTDNAFGTLIAVSPTGSPVSGLQSDFLAQFLISYKLMKTMTVYFNAERTLGPSIVGTILSRTSARAGLDYDVNELSTVSMYAEYVQLASPATTDFASATVQYTKRLTKTWTAKMSYTFLHRFTTTGNVLVDPITGGPTSIGLGPASSNNVLFVFSKSFVALPGGT